MVSAALERDPDSLYRVEEALVVAAIAAGEPVHRSPSAPRAAVLGVKSAVAFREGEAAHSGWEPMTVALQGASHARHEIHCCTDRQSIDAHLT